MLIRFLFVISSLFIFQACTENTDASKKPHEQSAKDTIDQNAMLVTKDTFPKPIATKNDTIPIHIFQKGETLWDLCKKYYDNRHYSSILSVYNKIQDVNRIAPGTKIKVPPLSTILMDKDFGLVPHLKQEVIKMLAARQLYIEVESRIWEFRRSLNGNSNQALPEEIVSNLVRASGLIDLTISQLNQPKEGAATLPNRMSNNLKSVSRNLKHLAAGANDGYGYDLDMVHQDWIRAIHSGKAWVKKNYEYG